MTTVVQFCSINTNHQKKNLCLNKIHGQESSTSSTKFSTFSYLNPSCKIQILRNSRAKIMAGANPTHALIILNIFFFASVSTHNVPCPPKVTPSPPSTTPGKVAKCPRDTLKFGVCGDWLGLVHEVIGAKPSSECCALVEGLADLEAALCLCAAIKVNVLGVAKFKIPVAISTVINSCGKKVPKGFVC